MVCPRANCPSPTSSSHPRVELSLRSVLGREVKHEGRVYSAPKRHPRFGNRKLQAKAGEDPMVFQKKGKAPPNSLIIQLTPQLPILLARLCLAIRFPARNLFYITLSYTKSPCINQDEEHCSFRLAGFSHVRYLPSPQSP
jgi:hypothetical protein